MEDVEKETTDQNAEGIAGKPQEEEKLLPPGDLELLPAPETPKKRAPVSPILVLPPEDLLHSGNAILAAQEQQKEKEEKTSEESSEEELANRNLRETGLKEALPRGTNAPSKVEAPSSETDTGLPRMHTYAEDMGKEIKKRGSTISSIITAERMQPEVSPPTISQPQNTRRNLFVGGAVLLVVLGIGALGTVLFLEQQQTQKNSSLPQTIIPVNSHLSIPLGDKKTLVTTLASAKTATQINLGEIEALDIATSTGAATAEEILTTLGAPNELARNATGILVGLHAYNHTQPFLIISVSAYDRAFDAMLTWEETMGNDLGVFFAPSGAPQGITNHPPVLSFGDTVSNNLDVRKSQEAWPILYAFPRQNLLVITTNESTLREIITRLSLQNASSQ